MNVELRARFFGRVQGVGFRASAAFAAKHLGLTGTVKNLDDGSVELIAQGPEASLKSLLHEIETVIFPGYITRIDKQFVKIERSLSGFSVF